MMTKASLKLRRAVLTNLIMECYPPIIQNDIFKRGVVPNEFGLKTEIGISFGVSGVTTRQSSLYRAVRNAFSNPKTKSIFVDDNNENWEVEIIDLDEGEYAISNGSRKMVLPSLWMLLPNRKQRKSAFENHANKYNLPNEEREFLLDMLSSKSLTDEQVDEIRDAFEMTPKKTEERVQQEIVARSSEISSLVPSNASYYYQLVGVYQDDFSLEDYTKNVVPSHFSALLEWSKVEGFELALLGCSHSWVSGKIDAASLNEEQLVSVFSDISEYGDLISQLGCVEIGVPLIAKYSSLRPYIINMLQKIRNDDPLDKDGAFTLLSSMITLVDGELSRTKVFSENQPYWRRMAAFAQAALLQRCINRGDVSKAKFADWAWSNRSQMFFFQNMVDLRKEPRWVPEYISPDQIKSEFIGRLTGVASVYSEALNDDELWMLLTDFSDVNLKPYADHPKPYLPGPLEGGFNTTVDLPDNLRVIIETSLDAEQVTFKSFIALVNSAHLFKLCLELADKAVLALRRTNHNISDLNDQNAGSLINGLATVAAVTRSVELADEIRILIRHTNHLKLAAIRQEEVFKFSLIAAAAHPNLQDWCSYLGRCILEISLVNIDRDEAERIHSHLSCLLVIVPELWATCSGAERALISVIGEFD